MAQSRLYEYDASVTTPTQPAAGTPTLSSDLLTLGFLSSGVIKRVGSRASPTSITAGAGIAFAAVAGYMLYMYFVKGNSGDVNVTVDPQIVAGTIEGQILILFGTSDTDTLLLEHGTGLELNGAARLKNGSILALVWDGVSKWTELYRNGIGDLG